MQYFFSKNKVSRELSKFSYELMALSFVAIVI